MKTCTYPPSRRKCNLHPKSPVQEQFLSRTSVCVVFFRVHFSACDCCCASFHPRPSRPCRPRRARRRQNRKRKNVVVIINVSVAAAFWLSESHPLYPSRKPHIKPRCCTLFFSLKSSIVKVFLAARVSEGFTYFSNEFSRLALSISLKLCFKVLNYMFSNTYFKIMVILLFTLAQLHKSL